MKPLLGFFGLVLDPKRFSFSPMSQYFSLAHQKSQQTGDQLTEAVIKSPKSDINTSERGSITLMYKINCIFLRAISICKNLTITIYTSFQKHKFVRILFIKDTKDIQGIFKNYCTAEVKIVFKKMDFH